MKETHYIADIRRTFFGSILGHDRLTFKTVDNVLCLSVNGKILHRFEGPDCRIRFEYGIFSVSLRIWDGYNSVTYDYIDEDDAKRCEKKLNDFLISYEIQTIKDEIPKLNFDITNGYLKDSKTEELIHNTLLLKKYFTKLKDLDPSSIEKIETDLIEKFKNKSDEIKDYLSIILNYCKSSSAQNESFVDLIRASYEESELKENKEFFDKAEKNPLTPMQRLSVVRDNDFNLVLAAAGTGKTSVMVAKALYLMKIKAVKSSELLILAYNRKAALELQQRIEQRAKVLGIDSELPQISTFHALGRKILLECDQSVHMSKLCDDEKKLNQWVANWERDFLHKHPFDYLFFYNSLYSREKNGIEINDNTSALRTLNDELVKSESERRIANWLCLYNIPYTYEAAYVAKRRIEPGFDYSPDFKLTDDIYIEFFGIDRNGNTRPDIDKEHYNKCIELKKQLHQEMGTTLIDLYSYEMFENTLFDKLEKRLLELGFSPKKKTNREIEELITSNIDKNVSSSLQKLLTNCLKAIRIENLNKDKILQRLKDADFTFADTIAKYLSRMVTDYVNTLKAQNEIDFDDMILTATKLINKKKWIPPYKYILIDEFQDISMSRYELIKAMYTHCKDVSCTKVGDDWEAIYRFAGGAVDLTTRFSEHFGQHSLTKLDKTFRYSKNIAKVAGDFVMSNPEQYKKDIETADDSDKPKIHLFSYSGDCDDISDYHNLYVEVRKLILILDKKSPESSVAVMSRYNHFLNGFKIYFTNQNRQENIKTSINIYYWTFHGSKGLEADYTILMGLQSGEIRAFPADNQDDKVVEALLPTSDDFTFSEERRLFYVALTRAKKHAYLFAQATRPSSFIKEMLKENYPLDVRDQCFTPEMQKTYKCPKCMNGYFVLCKGEYGDYYRCNSKVCNLIARVCPQCDSPMVDSKRESKCQNEQCAYSMPICDRCGRPMRIRRGKYGIFLGCSGYGLENDSCNNTREYSEDNEEA